MRKTSSKASLFLIELVISILFFAIAAAVCARAFVKSHNLSRQAQDLGMAEIILEDAQHQISVGVEIGEIKTTFDENWTACAEEDAEYVLSIEVVDGNMPEENNAKESGSAESGSSAEKLESVASGIGATTDEAVNAEENQTQENTGTLTTYHMSITNASGETIRELDFTEYTPWQLQAESKQEIEENSEKSTTKDTAKETVESAAERAAENSAKEEAAVDADKQKEAGTQEGANE